MLVGRAGHAAVGRWRRSWNSSTSHRESIMILNLLVGAILAPLGLAMAGGHWRPLEDWSAVAVAATMDRDDWATRRLRKMHELTPTVRRRLGWGIFWSSLGAFVVGVLQLFGVVS